MPGFIQHHLIFCWAFGFLAAPCQDRYKPRQDENGIAGGEGFLHYSADGKFVTVASGQGDPSKARGRTGWVLLTYYVQSYLIIYLSVCLYV